MKLIYFFSNYCAMLNFILYCIVFYCIVMYCVIRSYIVYIVLCTVLVCFFVRLPDVKLSFQNILYIYVFFLLYKQPFSIQICAIITRCSNMRSVFFPALIIMTGRTVYDTTNPNGEVGVQYYQPCSCYFANYYYCCCCCDLNQSLLMMTQEGSFCSSGLVLFPTNSY